MTENCSACGTTTEYNQVTLMCGDRFAKVVHARLCANCVQPWRDAHPLYVQGPVRYEWRPSTEYPDKYDVFLCTLAGAKLLRE